MEQPRYLCIMQKWIGHKPHLAYHGSNDGKVTLCGKTIKGQTVFEITDGGPQVKCFECRYFLKHGVKYGLENE